MTTKDLKTTEIKITEADCIWEEIKNLPINAYGFEQTVNQHLVKIPMPGNELLVKIPKGASLPALETSLNNTKLTQGRQYEIEQGDGFTIIRRAHSKKLEVDQLMQKK